MGRKCSKHGRFLSSQGKIKVCAGSRKDVDEVLSRKLTVDVKVLGGLWVWDRARKSQFAFCEMCEQRNCTYM